MPYVIFLKYAVQQVTVSSHSVRRDIQPTDSMEESPWEANSPSDSQEISTFYGTQRFITMFMRAFHGSLS